MNKLEVKGRGLAQHCCRRHCPLNDALLLEEPLAEEQIPPNGCGSCPRSSTASSTGSCARLDGSAYGLLHRIDQEAM